MPHIENERRFRWLTTLLLAGFVLLLQFGYDNFGSDVRFLNDYYDRSDYAHIGANVLSGEIPYVDVAIEYPQVPVYLFRGFTWLASRILPAAWPPEVGFLILWQIFISIITLLCIWKLWQLLPEKKKGLAWLMFLPAAIYFSLNRFDILPVYLSLLAFMEVRKGHFEGAAVFLAIGTLTKWYLILIFPFFLIYQWKHSRSYPWRPILVFGSVCMLILLPTFILGGWTAVWQPFGWHIVRMAEPGTFLWLFNAFFGKTGLGQIESGSLTTIFTLLGFSGILLVFLKEMGTVRKIILVSIVSLLIFIFFTRIFSPQWWLWILPFLILTIDNQTDLFLIVLYDLVVYAAFPIAYDLYGIKTTPYIVITGLLLVLAVVILIRTIMKLKRTEEQVQT